MEGTEILDLLRPLVVIVQSSGTIHKVHGGHGGFLGHDPQTFVGTNVFDYVVADQVDELATYFLENAGESLETIELPMPFRVTLVGADGLDHPADVIPTATTHDGELWGWVVTIVPVALNTSVSRSLDAEMAGRPRDEVKTMLTEELVVENANFSSRWFLFYLGDAPTVSTSRAEDRPLAEQLATAVTERCWRPWEGMCAGECRLLSDDELPPALQSFAADRNWRRFAVTPVYVDGVIVAAYLQCGRVPCDYPIDEIKTNVRTRIGQLVSVTSLLISRWNDRDRLLNAAMSDSLTGLANRVAFSHELAQVDADATLLYIDVDRFKAVNDQYGHDVGDQVLVEVAKRISAACRPDDIVARFGGDEFVVLLRGAGHADAHAIGDRILAAVAAPLTVADGPSAIRVSVGLAEVSGDNDAIDLADQAMLQAKRDGRDRLVSA